MEKFEELVIENPAAIKGGQCNTILIDDVIFVNKSIVEDDIIFANGIVISDEVIF